MSTKKITFSVSIKKITNCFKTAFIKAVFLFVKPHYLWCHMDQTFKKIEKLKSEKLIEQLFSEGKSVATYPLRLVYLKTVFDDPIQIKTGVSVSKRNFKKAVDRNRIKRLMREAYRLNKSNNLSNITEQYAFMILYVGKTTTDFKTISNKMNILMDIFLRHETPAKS